MPHLPHRRLTAQGDIRIVSDVLCQLPRGGFNGVAVIALPQKRHHRTARVARARIIDHRFEAVTHLDAVLAIIRRHQQQNAAIVFLASDSKLPEEIDRIIFDALPIQRTNRNDGELRACFLFEFRAEGFQFSGLVGPNDSRQVRHVARGMDALDVFSPRENCAKKRRAQQDSSSGKMVSAH